MEKLQELAVLFSSQSYRKGLRDKERKRISHGRMLHFRTWITPRLSFQSILFLCQWSLCFVWQLNSLLINKLGDEGRVPLFIREHQISPFLNNCLLDNSSNTS